MFIAAIVVIVVAVAAAGAFVLMNDSGASDQNNNASNSNSNDNNNGTKDNTSSNAYSYSPKDGDFMEFKTTTVSSAMSFDMTMRWAVSNVTSTGYDITLNHTNTLFGYSYSNTIHANLTDDVGSGAVDENYTKGTLVGTETLSTSFGTKQVEHWRLQETDGSKTTVTDYYIGKDTKMTYKMVVTETDSSDSNGNATITTVLTDTNIVSLTARN
ncbi:MAG: hypothetical protein SA339_10600 [Methanomassiliicoccus sp.]|nr:hypothetical protein [Methanomassiliicoccus sp.]